MRSSAPTPLCRQPLYRIDSETGARILNSRIAHICARRERGPRWDPRMSAAQNRSADNLIQLCIEHSFEIDDPNRVDDFPIELLHEWKKRQLTDFDRRGQGWNLSDAEADEAIQVSVEVVSLGGEGGRHIGAGGGGGAGVGPGARGGPGGAGGSIHLHVVMQQLMEQADEVVSITYQLISLIQRTVRF
jgi:hypothetical protein